MRMERCQTSRCSDLYDRYIPGYMAPSTSSSSESAQQRDNRQPQMMSTQLSNNVGDNQIEKFITAAHGGDMVSQPSHRSSLVKERSDMRKVTMYGRFLSLRPRQYTFGFQ